MALSHRLSQGGTAPERLETSVTVTFQPGEGITRAAIRVVGTVPGVDAGVFAQQAEDAKAGCPLAKALTGIPEIAIDARLA